MAERKPIISFRNFSFQYRAQKRPTLTDIDLEIYPGERVLIAGPSGSGKSTLAGCINGLNPFSNPGACTGTLTVDGVDAPHSSLFELSAHVDSLVLDDTDTQKLRDWFTARPRPAAQPERESLLEVKGLSFGYQKGQQTLRDVSFSIGKGEMVSIVGRNGAGKSTLSKLICGFETPDAGEIFLNGKPLAEENIRRRAQHIGYVMQNPNQMISKTMIYEEVALGLQRSGLTEEQIREKVEATLKVCGLYPFRNWPISALSFGQKKRVTIASVLVLDPELILLDEPTAGQDFRHYTDIMEFLRGLNARGVTVVMITHDMHLMLEYTRRALVFCDGRLIADRTAAAVLCDPALVEQAALKETSLYTLANRCGSAPAQEFVERFIEQDREVREGGR